MIFAFQSVHPEGLQPFEFVFYLFGRVAGVGGDHVEQLDVNVVNSRAILLSKVFL